MPGTGPEESILNIQKNQDFIDPEFRSTHVILANRRTSRDVRAIEMSETYPFYALSGLLKTWMLHQGSAGCMRTTAVGLGVCLDRMPPGVKDSKAENAEPVEKLLIERNAKASGYFKGVLRQLIEERRIKAEVAGFGSTSAAASVDTPPSACIQKQASSQVRLAGNSCCNAPDGATQVGGIDGAMVQRIPELFPVQNR